MLARTLLGCRREATGGRLVRWRYDRRRRVLYAVISVRRGGLVAHAC